MISVVAEFGEHYFLENLVVRPDDSVLVTAMNQRELWFVAPQSGREPMTPVLVHRFQHPVTAIVQTGPDVLLVAESEVYTDGPSRLVRVDLSDWTAGDTVHPEVVVTLDRRARALNGGCLLSPDIVLLADSLAGLIWRVDLSAQDVTADVWLADDSMTIDPARPMSPVQPGINGIRYDAGARFVYYTSTSRELFMRVAVDPVALTPTAAPQHVGGGTMADDFCLDPVRRVAYVTTHRQNTIDRVDLDGPADQPRVIVAGEPTDERLLGPSSAAWGRLPGEPGRVLFVTSDGGTTAPLPDGSVRSAKLLRVELDADS